MLICNNCGCVHQKQVTVCEQCHIPGNFTITPDEANTTSTTETVMCINCGKHIGADLHRCPECRFPLPKAIQTIQTGKQLTPFTRNLKLG